MTTDTSEKGLETLIVRHMTGVDGLSPPSARAAVRVPATGPRFGSPRADAHRRRRIDSAGVLTWTRPGGDHRGLG